MEGVSKHFLFPQRSSVNTMELELHNIVLPQLPLTLGTMNNDWAIFLIVLLA